MKKLILILAVVSMTFISCQKEEINKNEEPIEQLNCNCGVIVDQDHYISGELRNIVIENYCSKGLMTYWPTTQQLTSMALYIGAEWCYPYDDEYTW